MAVIGTFGSYTAARLGIYASQASLNVTGNNIANINTTGYTRQRMDLSSIYGGGTDRYASSYNVNIGYGVLTDGVSQLRDPYIDIRYRTEQSNLGQEEYKMKALEELSAKLDEVGDGKGEFGVIERQFNDLVQQLENLSEKTGSQDYDTLVRGSAKTLTDLFQNYAKGLEEIRENEEVYFDSTVKEVNTILTNIRNLNESIRKANICGDKALELRDERNVQIDELSKLMKINVTYDMERIDQYTEVERLNIAIADDQGIDQADLVRGIFVGQLEYQQPSNPNPYMLQVDELKNRWDKVFVDKDGNPSQDEPLDDDALVGGLQALREILTEEGEFASPADLAADPAANIKRGIPYYQKALDLLANKFAQVMNEANQLPIDTLTAAYELDPTKTFFVDEKGADIGITKAQVEQAVKDAEDGKLSENDRQNIYETLRAKGVLTKEYDFYKGGPLISNSSVGNDTTGITASNITIAYDWANQKTRILNTLRPNEILKPKQAVYESDIIKQATVPGNLTIGGYTCTLSPTEDTLEQQLKTFADAYNADTTNTQWTASVNGDKNRIIFTAKDSGSLETTHATPPTGTTVKVAGSDETKITHTTANDNINHIISQFSTKMDYDAKAIEPNADADDFFYGTFQEFFTNISHTLATDQETTELKMNNHEIQSLKEENNRQSVSGVDLNDEATNMMQFQKSYQAACRLLTTLDSMLNTLINNTI